MMAACLAHDMLSCTGLHQLSSGTASCMGDMATEMVVSIA